MKPAEIEVKIACARREMEYWQAALATKCCRACQKWDGSGCALAQGITPPPDVQATGCPEWTWDQIPF